MTITFTNTRELWSFNQTLPLQTLNVTQIAQDDAGADITLDDVTSAVGKPNIGDQYPSRSVYIKSIKWSQTTPKICEATLEYDSVLFNPASYDENTVQSVHADVAGYVNTDISAQTYSANWWRYQAASSWQGTTANDYPWTTATPSTDHQEIIEAATSIAVDSGGTPMTRPILGQQLVVALTFETKPTALRAYWRSLRGTRNNATFLGDGIGEWLFSGANQHATTTSELYTVELSFYRDPFGWCRQRAKTDANGRFTVANTVEIDNPSGGTCADTETMRVASCVYWAQLYPTLGDFSDLLTTAQMAQVSELIA